MKFILELEQYNRHTGWLTKIPVGISSTTSLSTSS